ncbi:MAG: hypothetical protein IT287_06160, partial [Bdellovibrionaceae bacterium]|nr:hypothetical protein [Pseudobdellovibrionaceae bacterium]
MTDDGKYTIGGLAENPRGEQKYYEDFYPNAGGEQGVKNFRSTNLYKRLGITKPVAQIIGTSVTSANFSGIRQMKDAADLIVLDTLFGQQDRFGNVHSIHTFMIGKGKDLKKVSLMDVEDMIAKDGTDTEKKQLGTAMAMPSDWRKEVMARNNLLLKIVSGYFERNNIPFAHSQEIVMKDNDCGLKGSNVFMGAKMISGVNHISEKTYSQLMRLYEKSSKGELDSYLSETLYMDSDEMAQFKKGLNYVATTLNAKCAANQLYLDLNVKDHFQGTNITAPSCDVMATPTPAPQPQAPAANNKTADGFPIHTIIKAGVSLRTLALENEMGGTTDASKYTVSGVPQLGMVGDQVAVLGTIDIGANRFAKIRVIQSQQLPI